VTVWTADAAGASFMAQGVTTAAIRGTVRAAGGGDAEGAQIHVVNRATGYAVEADVRHGIFFVQGLEVGGRYAVLVRRIGSLPQEHGGHFLTLGQRLELDFVLEPAAARLDTVRIVAVEHSGFSRSRTGIGGTSGRDGAMMAGLAWRTVNTNARLADPPSFSVKGIDASAR